MQKSAYKRKKDLLRTIQIIPKHYGTTDTRKKTYFYFYYSISTTTGIQNNAI